MNKKSFVPEPFLWTAVDFKNALIRWGYDVLGGNGGTCNPDFGDTCRIVLESDGMDFSELGAQVAAEIEEAFNREF